jgi:hypothetical protein
MVTPENILQVAKDNKAKKAEKVKVEKAKKIPEKKAEPESIFPAEGKINKYGFIYVSGDVLKAFGVTKGVITKLSIDLDGDKLIIRKA